jgi:hypothetical protein
MVISNSPFIVDTLYLKHVIFQNSHIIYRGGPVILEDVYFVNCTFEVVQQSAGQSFAKAILDTSESTSFSTHS